MKRRLAVNGRAAALLAAVLLFIEAASCTGIRSATALTDLSNLAQLREVFNRDYSNVRVVALLSPT